ncbi:alpha amylase C-terminal domain-containing protein [Vibrio vulnificus]|nr:alpha amylase C-terminal domain-containing protein [Vibrio vulnificus]
MLIELDESIFVDKYNSQLDYILQSGLQGFVYVNFESDKPRVNKWISKNNDEWNRVLDTYLLDSSSFEIYNSAIVKDVEKSNFDSQVPILTPDDAVVVLKKPVELYLENSRNDKRFLSLVLNKYERMLLSKLEDKELISFSSGGVDELYKLLCDNVSKKGRRNKRFVLIDSDSTAPNVISESAVRITEHCQSNSISYHVLERRAIENYLPIQFLINRLRPEYKVPTNKDYKKYTTYLSMTPEQRYHFHMKKGFNDESCRNSGLYDVECANLQPIKDGFTSKYADKFLNSSSDYDEIHDIIKQNDENGELVSLSRKIMCYIRLPL